MGLPCDLGTSQDLPICAGLEYAGPALAQDVLRRGYLLVNLSGAWDVKSMTVILRKEVKECLSKHAPTMPVRREPSSEALAPLRSQLAGLPQNQLNALAAYYVEGKAECLVCEQNDLSIDAFRALRAFLRHRSTGARTRFSVGVATA